VSELGNPFALKLDVDSVYQLSRSQAVALVQVLNAAFSDAQQLAVADSQDR
jgi:hypothetical protein